MTIAEQRASVAAEARSWLGTPYHHGARAKGAGVDCAMLPVAVYAACGLIAPPAIAHYPADWHLHRADERYLAHVAEPAVELAGALAGDPQPGDFVLWRFGRCFSHGAIVIAWPVIIHAVIRRGVVLDDAARSAQLTHIGEAGGDQGRPRPRRAFTLKIWAARSAQTGDAS